MISYVHPNYVRRHDEVTAEQLPGLPVPGVSEARRRDRSRFGPGVRGYSGHRPGPGMGPPATWKTVSEVAVRVGHLPDPYRLDVAYAGGQPVGAVEKIVMDEPNPGRLGDHGGLSCLPTSTTSPSSYRRHL